jgi:hypothetical protein
MHSLIEKSLIKWLKRAGFEHIRTEQELIIDGVKFRPDVYAKKGGEEFIFEIVVNHLNFWKYLPLIKQDFRMFMVMPHEDYIDNERINLFEIKKPISVIVGVSDRYLDTIYERF